MYAVIGIWKVLPGNNEEMQKIADRAHDRLKGKKGFKSAVYFSDETKGEYGNLTVWESKEDFENFRSHPSPDQADELKKFMAKVTGQVIERQIYYVNNLF